MTARNVTKPQPVPEPFDYDLWLGPAPVKPYHPHRTHGSFRGYWDYDGGGLADMGQHYLDPVQYLLDKDGTSPVEIEAYAPWPPHPDAVRMWGRVKMTYADGCCIILESGEWGERETEGQPLFLYYATQLPHGPLIARDLRSYGDKPWDLKHKEWAAMVQTMDESFGAIVDELEREGLLENTIFFFAVISAVDEFYSMAKRKGSHSNSIVKSPSPHSG